jgi:hypothetical protein
MSTARQRELEIDDAGWRGTAAPRPDPPGRRGGATRTTSADLRLSGRHARPVGRLVCVRAVLATPSGAADRDVHRLAALLARPADGGAAASVTNGCFLAAPVPLPNSYAYQNISNGLTMLNVATPGFHAHHGSARGEPG